MRHLVVREKKDSSFHRKLAGPVWHDGRHLWVLWVKLVPFSDLDKYTGEAEASECFHAPVIKPSCSHCVIWQTTIQVTW